MRYENIFVLSPGRSGSMSFVEACKNLTNYTAAHESRAGHLGDERFNYPKGHIEADNRLTWFLGDLEERFSGAGVLYIHLQRDFAQTADSFLHRLRNSAYRASIMNAFAHGILMKPGDWSPEEEVEIAKFYVNTVHANIRRFIKDKNFLNVRLGDSGKSFNEFLTHIHAEGDLVKAGSDWLTVHNAR